MGLEVTSVQLVKRQPSEWYREIQYGLSLLEKVVVVWELPESCSG
jgi:hypothetical protein